MQNENTIGKIKSTISFVAVCIFISTIFYGLTTGKFQATSLLSGQVHNAGAIRSIETAKEMTGWGDIAEVLREESIRGQNRSSKGKDSFTAKPTITKVELIHDVDCSKIDMPNKEQEKKAKYACSLHPNSIMLASFHQEAGRNEWAVGGLKEKGICQLLPNRTNNVRIKDKRWSDWYRQIDRCVSKRKSVPNQKQIWASYGSSAYKKYLYFFTK